MEAQTARLPPASPPLQGTASAANAVARVSYTHDSMIDLLIANPMVSQNELAAHFGYSVGWVSRVRNSDAFLARLAERKQHLVDPSIAATIDEKLRAVADRSLDIVLDKLNQFPSLDQAVAVMEKTTKALGYGARQQNLAVQQNFVVALPGKAPDSASWAARYGSDLAGLKAQAAAAVEAVVVTSETNNA